MPQSQPCRIRKNGHLSPLQKATLSLWQQIASSYQHSGPWIPTSGLLKYEAQFATCKITAQQTMYKYVIASLTPEFATLTSGTSSSTIPEDHPYDHLKASLIRRLQPPNRDTCSSSSTLNSRKTGSSPSHSATFTNSSGTPRPICHHLFSKNCSPMTSRQCLHCPDLQFRPYAHQGTRPTQWPQSP